MAGPGRDVASHRLNTEVSSRAGRSLRWLMAYGGHQAHQPAFRHHRPRAPGPSSFPSATVAPARDRSRPWDAAAVRRARGHGPPHRLPRATSALCHHRPRGRRRGRGAPGGSWCDALRLPRRARGYGARPTRGASRPPPNGAAARSPHPARPRWRWGRRSSPLPPGHVYTSARASESITDLRGAKPAGGGPSCGTATLALAVSRSVGTSPTPAQCAGSTPVPGMVHFLDLTVRRPPPPRHCLRGRRRGARV
jgi:hypothetical protein